MLLPPNPTLNKQKVKVTPSCPTLCDPMDYTVLGILPARILEWVALPFSRGSSQPRSPTLQSDSLPAELSGKHAAAAKSIQSCPTLRTPRQQPTRLPRPWDSPGKNTGVGCHFLLQCMIVKSESEVTESCLTPSNPMDCSRAA